MSLDPINDPQAYDFVTIAGARSPGICVVSGAKRAQKWDVKDGKGTKGATTTFTNLPPAAFTIKFQLWTAQHFADWDRFRPLLKYDPTKKAAQAFDIFHPALAHLGIVSVVCEDLGQVEHDGQGMYSITCSFLEYFPAPPTPIVSTPQGSRPVSKDGPGAPPGLPPDPVGDDKNKEIAELFKKAFTP